MEIDRWHQTTKEENTLLYSPVYFTHLGDNNIDDFFMFMCHFITLEMQLSLVINTSKQRETYAH